MGRDVRILVVNADDNHRSNICGVLRAGGYDNILQGGDSQTAIDLIAEETFDILVTDVEIGNLDGWRLTRLIRSGALSVSPDMPIIIVSTTYSERIAEVTAKEYQVSSFLPIDEHARLPAVIEDIEARGTSGPRKSTLLVVEDYPDTIKLIERVLGPRFDIEVTMDGEAGIAAWKANRHDLVLLDVMLPEKSGKDVLKEILAVSPTQSVVMMTAYATPERAGALILEGAVDFISKPFRAEQLRKVCEIAVQREDFIISNQQFAQRQEALYDEKERVQITLQSIADGVITTDVWGKVDYLNPVAERLTGWRKVEAQGKQVSQILRAFHEANHLPVDDPVVYCLKEGRVVSGQRNVIFRNREGRELRLDSSASPIHNRLGHIVGSVMVFRDVTEAYELERKLEYQARHDALTGLTNRSAFEERLKRILDDESYKTVDFALCYIDLDQFKVINDTCGHGAGDQLLRHIADIMLQKIRKTHDTLARFGGDEFVLLLEECAVDQAARVAETICEAIQDYRFVYDGKTFNIGASIGVVPISTDAFTVNNALARADSACYMAKEKGRNRIHVYRFDDEELMQRHGEMQVVAKINEAFEADRFVLFRQPVMPLHPDCSGGEHYEILIRMLDGDDSWVAPGFFLPAAERYNIAPKMDRWVIRNALSWLAKNPSELEKLAVCSINLSGLSLCDDNFIRFIEDQLTEFTVPPEKLCFEITETAAISNLMQAASFVKQMRQHGCTFALDDFGAGMSSYAYLKRLPVDYLKVDGLFVRDVLHDPIDRAMVKSINEIGHVFGLKTIAEYVENENILNEMREIGLDFVQGYAVGKPVSLSDAWDYERIFSGAMAS